MSDETKRDMGVHIDLEQIKQRVQEEPDEAFDEAVGVTPSEVSQLGEVAPMFKSLEAPVRNCWTCPFSRPIEVDLFKAVWGCSASKRTRDQDCRVIPEPDPEAKEVPDWCPVRIQPVVVRWRGEP